MAVVTPVQIRRRMSQSIINQADTCLKRTEYDFFHDTPVMGGVGLGIGTGYHAGLAEGYLQRMHGDPHDIDKCVAAGVEAFGLSSLWEVAASGFALGAVTCFWCVVDNGHLLSWLLRSLDLDSD